MPAVNMKTGAQMWVIQRVRNIAVVVRARNSGENDIAPWWKKSRVWSMAMRTMTRPRRASTEGMRILDGADVSGGPVI